MDETILEHRTKADRYIQEVAEFRKKVRSTDLMIKSFYVTLGLGLLVSVISWLSGRKDNG